GSGLSGAARAGRPRPQPRHRRPGAAVLGQGLGRTAAAGHSRTARPGVDRQPGRNRPVADAVWRHQRPSVAAVSSSGVGVAPAAEEAVRLGVALVHLGDDAHLHVLHMVAYPLDRIWSTGLSDSWSEAYRRQVRTAAEEAIRAQLERAGSSAADERVEIHLVD